MIKKREHVRFIGFNSYKGFKPKRIYITDSDEIEFGCGYSNMVQVENDFGQLVNVSANEFERLPNSVRFIREE